MGCTYEKMDCVSPRYPLFFSFKHRLHQWRTKLTFPPHLLALAYSRDEQTKHPSFRLPLSQAKEKNLKPSSPFPSMSSNRKCPIQRANCFTSPLFTLLSCPKETNPNTQGSRQTTHKRKHKLPFTLFFGRSCQPPSSFYMAIYSHPSGSLEHGF